MDWFGEKEIKWVTFESCGVQINSQDKAREDGVQDNREHWWPMEWFNRWTYWHEDLQVAWPYVLHWLIFSSKLTKFIVVEKLWYVPFNFPTRSFQDLEVFLRNFILRVLFPIKLMLSCNNKFSYTLVMMSMRNFDVI